MVSVPQIDLEHNIVIKDFVGEVQESFDSRTDEECSGVYWNNPTFIEGEFTVKINPNEGDKGKCWTRNMNEGVQEFVLGWGISHEDLGGCGPAWGMAFGLRNLSSNKQRLPITAKFHVMKNGRKAKTLNTVSRVLEPTERSERKKRLEVEDDEDESDQITEVPEEDGYDWVVLFTPEELEGWDDEDTELEDEEEEEDSENEDEVTIMTRCLDKKGNLNIRLEISIVYCCLSLAGKRPRQPESEEVQDNSLEKRIRTNAVNSLAEDMAGLRDKAASDLTLTCQGESFQDHKAILSARSDVFASMLAKVEDNSDSCSSASGWKGGEAGRLFQ